MKPRRPVTGITSSNQIPLLEFRVFGEHKPKWIVWLSYNPDRDAGTYLILNDDGSIWRETTYPDGGVDTVLITPASERKRKYNHER